MTNGNDLAYSFEYTRVSAENGTSTTYLQGLTKLEYFACAAMQGLISNEFEYDSKAQLARHSIDYAKALIDELNRSGG